VALGISSRERILESLPVFQVDVRIVREIVRHAAGTDSPGWTEQAGTQSGIVEQIHVAVVIGVAHGRRRTENRANSEVVDPRLSERIVWIVARGESNAKLTAADAMQRIEVELVHFPAIGAGYRFGYLPRRPSVAETILFT